LQRKEKGPRSILKHTRRASGKESRSFGEKLLRERGIFSTKVMRRECPPAGHKEVQNWTESEEKPHSIYHQPVWVGVAMLHIVNLFLFGFAKIALILLISHSSLPHLPIPLPLDILPSPTPISSYFRTTAHHN
jgi:hypothetical protein